MKEKHYDVYIMANKRNGTFYIGVTSNLSGRVFEHKNKVFPKSFTSRYGISLLVYYETHYDIYNAIRREKQLKRWPRIWKAALIEKLNPYWNDLYPRICG